jgi:hypothetical protein
MGWTRVLFVTALIAALCVTAACGGDGSGGGFDVGVAANSGSSSGGGSSSSSSSGGSSSSGSSSGGSSSTSNPPYLPFYATATSDTAGLFLVSQENLTGTSLPITSEPLTAFLGAATQYTLSASNRVVSFQRYSIMYAATGADGNVHVYGLPLATGNALPVQLSSFTLGSRQYCSAFSAQTNLKDPTTLFVVLDIATECTKDDVYEVVHWTDSPTAAPQSVTIPFLPMTALYQPGGLLGGLLVDSNSGTLSYYAGTTFTNPITIASGLSSWVVQYQSSVGVTGNMAEGDSAFLDLTGPAGEALWRVSYDGTASVVHTVAGQLGSFVADDTNIYFYDAVASTSQQHVFQQPINSNSPAEIELYTATPVVADPAAQDILVPLQLIGSDDQRLVVTATSYDLANLPPIGVAPTVLSSSVQSLQVGVAATPTTIAGPFTSALLNAFMTSPTIGDYAAQNVYVNVLSSQNSGATRSYTGEVFSPEGAVVTAAVANSTFIAVPPFYRPQASWSQSFFGPVLQYSGITDSNGMLGGSTITPFAVTSGAGAPLLGSDGQTYRVPAGQAPILLAASSTALTGNFTVLTYGSPGDGYGAYSTLMVELFGGVTMQPTALAIDLSQGVLAPISQSGASVSGF